MIKVFNAYMGTEVKLTDFNLFVSVCNYLAEKLRTLVEHREYTEHGWGSVCFMTDKFGGGYASFHFDLKTGEVTYMKGHPEEEQVNDLERMVELVKTGKKRMEKARDLQAVSEAVNAEY